MLHANSEESITQTLTMKFKRMILNFHLYLEKKPLYIQILYKALVMLFIEKSNSFKINKYIFKSKMK